MEDYYERSIRPLQLAGLSECTQFRRGGTIPAPGSNLLIFIKKTPDLISENELENFFLHRKNEDEWAPATLRIRYSGIKFFFINVLERNWHLFDYLNAKSSLLSDQVISLIFQDKCAIYDRKDDVCLHVP